MNGPDPLSQLRDIHLPAPIGWWPPAPGWWIVSFLLLAGCGFGIYFLLRLRGKKRHRRAALQQLATLAGNPDHCQVLQRTATLIRQVAIASYGRQQVAQLSGDKWLAFLDRTGATDQFSSGAGRLLGDAIYRSAPVEETEQLLRLARQWIVGHRIC